MPPHSHPQPTITTNLINKGQNFVAKTYTTQQMAPSSRILKLSATAPESSPSTSYFASQPTFNLATNTDIIVVLASLICALLCIAGLGMVARCACGSRRRSSSSNAQPNHHHHSPAAPKAGGIKKRVLETLPKFPFTSADATGLSLTDCAICLSEFEEGEEIRTLPQCGHGFHVLCIDTWLASRSSCPSCRRRVVVVVAPAGDSNTCRGCGASSGEVVVVAGGADYLP